MNRKRVEEYHNYGCNFYGNLVVFDYFTEMKNDPKFGQFCSMVVYDYIDKAEQIAKELYTDFEVLLSMPDYVIRLK